MSMHAELAGKVCTTRDVSACSSVAKECESFKPPYDKQFEAMFPKAYGQVCVEPISGEQCMYTDVVYETCDEAKISEFNMATFNIYIEGIYMGIF